MCQLPTTFSQQATAAGADIQIPQEVKDVLSPPRLYRHAVQHLVSKAESKVGAPSAGHGKFTCTIYSMHNKDFKENPDGDEVTLLPGDKVQDSSGFKAGTDEAQEKCFQGLHTSWKFFDTCFGRNSLDNQGLELRASIHLKKSFGGAFWDPNQQQMFFGDGGLYSEEKREGVAETITKTTSRLSPYSIDVVGHELTHGMVAKTAVLGIQTETADPTLLADNSPLSPELKAELANLPLKQREGLSKMSNNVMRLSLLHYPHIESQTLNEHIADCFGIMVKHFSLGHTAEHGNWDIAQGWWSEATMKDQNWTSNYLRTFKVPASGSLQPDEGAKVWSDKIKFYIWVDPHDFCGICNHAFYRAALKFKGETWKSVGEIWYNALTDETFKDPKKQTFKGWRDLTVLHAEKLFGDDGAKKMTEAWKAVNL